MKIIRNQVNGDASTLKQVHLKIDMEDGSIMERWKMEAYMYPNYQQEIKLTIPGLGFSLSISDAKNLTMLLTEALKEFKE